MYRIKEIIDKADGIIWYIPQKKEWFWWCDIGDIQYRHKNHAEGEIERYILAKKHKKFYTYKPIN